MGNNYAKRIHKAKKAHKIARKLKKQGTQSPNTPNHPLLQLQSLIGNQAVQRMIQRQPDLTLSMEDFTRMENERATPINEWLDSNRTQISMYSMFGVMHLVRVNVASAQEITVVDLQNMVRQWTAQNNIVLPRLSALPVGGEGIPGASTKDNFAELGEAVKSALSVDGEVKIGDAKGHLEIGVNGNTAELVSPDEQARIQATSGGVSAQAGDGEMMIQTGINWNGQAIVNMNMGGVLFNATVGADRWEIKMAFPNDIGTPNILGLAQVFRRAELAVRQTANHLGHNRLEAIRDENSTLLDDLKEAVDSVMGVGETPEGQVNFNISAQGNMDGTGTAIFGTLTYTF